jgi:predicted small lipoprotein YifL
VSKAITRGVTVKRFGSGILLAALAIALAGCGGDSGPRETPLAVLATDSEALDGSRVVTEGVVRHFEEPLHYWIEDEDLNRVELFPHEAIAPHLGERVRVEGPFAFSREEGRRLTLERVEVLATAD